MKTINKVILATILIALAVTVRATIGFSNTVDILVSGFFVLLGAWFFYDHAKKGR